MSTLFLDQTYDLKPEREAQTCQSGQAEVFKSVVLRTDL